jgi:predicted DNA-binding ribbon-helix-helix protein
MIEHKTIRVRAKTWTLLKQLSDDRELSLTLIVDNLVREHIAKLPNTKKPQEQSAQG